MENVMSTGWGGRSEHGKGDKDCDDDSLKLMGL